jgi:membrane-associated protease RseP (regulator of RpoE activity)
LADPDVYGATGPPSPSPARSSTAEIVRLVAVVAAVLAIGFAAGYGETLLLILILIGCIVAHEFGHFIAAKRGRVKVTEFFVGFGPRLWSIRRGETEYGVKGIPLGGYCRIIGMNNLDEVEPEDEARTYRAAPLWRRMLIDVAGSSMHFVIALVVLFAMFFWTGDQGHYLQPPDTPIVGGAVPFTTGPSPAMQAGFRPGDLIVAIDGQAMPTWTATSKYIQAHPRQRLDFAVQRGGQTIHLFATPVAANTVKSTGSAQFPSGTVGVVGIDPDTNLRVHSSFGAAISRTGGAFVFMGSQTFDALGHLVTLHGLSSYGPMLTSQKAAQSNQDQQLTTVVALPSALNQAGEIGLPTVLWLLALINLSIGIINLMPFFPVDGGRVVVGIYEGIRGIWRRGYRVDMYKLLPVMYTMLTLFMLYSAGWILINLRTLSS